MTSKPEPDIIIRPGVPGLGFESMEDGTAGYPSSATNLIKLLREHGTIAEYDRPSDKRSELAHKAADVWLPVLEIVKDVSIGVLSACIFELVTSPRSRVHVKIGRRRHGTTEWIEASGERDDVVEAIAQLLADEDEDDD